MGSQYGLFQKLLGKETVLIAKFCGTPCKFVNLLQCGVLDWEALLQCGVLDWEALLDCSTFLVMLLATSLGTNFHLGHSVKLMECHGYMNT